MVTLLFKNVPLPFKVCALFLVLKHILIGPNAIVLMELNGELTKFFKLPRMEEHLVITPTTPSLVNSVNLTPRKVAPILDPPAKQLPIVTTIWPVPLINASFLFLLPQVRLTLPTTVIGTHLSSVTTIPFVLLTDVIKFWAAFTPKHCSVMIIMPVPQTDVTT